MAKIIFTLNILCIPFLVGGCAFDLVHVEQIPTKLNLEKSCNKSFVLTKNVEIQLGGGYSRTLKKGTRWRCIGMIDQGEIYKTNDQILTIEASNIFEAYIVISSNKLVGFYLPVEDTFSPLGNSAELAIDETSHVQNTNQ